MRSHMLPEQGLSATPEMLQTAGGTRGQVATTAGRGLSEGQAVVVVGMAGRMPRRPAPGDMSSPDEMTADSGLVGGPQMGGVTEAGGHLMVTAGVEASQAGHPVDGRRAVQAHQAVAAGSHGLTAGTGEAPSACFYPISFLFLTMARSMQQARTCQNPPEVSDVYPQQKQHRRRTHECLLPSTA